MDVGARRLRELRRDAAVLRSNVGTAGDVAALTHALADPEPLVREHAAWALGRTAASERVAAAPKPRIDALAATRG